VGDDADGAVADLVQDRGRIGEEEEVGVQVGQGVDVRFGAEEVHQQGRGAGEVVLHQGAVVTRGGQLRVGLLQVVKGQQVDVGQLQAEQNLEAELAEAEDVEPEGVGVVDERLVEG
jgi:hypothetical protein